jgi:SAM-dependent methyltransferase
MPIAKAAHLGARVLRKLARGLESAAGAQTRDIHRSMAAYDMAGRPDETHYLAQYWAAIEPALAAHLPSRTGRILDLGCGQGRLTVPLARWLEGGNVTGVDLTPSAVAAARAYAAEAGVRATFIDGDALAFANGIDEGSIDAVFMLEISFFMPRYRELLARAAKLLRPGGLLGVSFRGQYFNLLGAARAGDWASARLTRDAREGHWLGGTTWFSWHTPDDVRALIAAEGLHLDALRGIGVLSGIENDPLSLIAQPSRLDDDARAQLLELELSLAETYAGNGRYILVLSTKPQLEAVPR